MPGLIDTASW